MDLLRKYIQDILTESEEKQWSSWFQSLTPQQRRMWGARRNYIQQLDAPDVPHPNTGDTLQTDYSQVTAPQNRPLTSLRRKLKHAWNDWVYNQKNNFADFWEDVDNVLCIHWVGLFEGNTPESYEDLLLNYINTKNSNNQPDLSCMGYFNPNGWNMSQNALDISEVKRRIPPQAPVGIIFKERRVTFASYRDLWTEFISSAGEEELKFYSSSSLPKRPFSGFPVDDIIFGIEEMTNGNYLNEVIITNYDWDTLIISPARCKKTKHKGVHLDPERLKSIATENNLNFIIR
jgi:hypothetical protein